jgi:AraC-like DNA-binding protein
MKSFQLSYFTQNTDFPFFIQYGQHEENLFIHTHTDFNELTIVLSGTATHIVNNEKYFIKKGDMFVISDNIAHGFENPHDFKICNIMYRLNDLLRSDNDITKSAGFHALFVIEPFLNRDNKFNSRLQLSFSQFEAIIVQIASMINEYNNKLDGWKTILYGDFLHLIVLLSRAYDVNSDNKDMVLNIARPITYIGNHFTEAISVVDLAKMANMSVRHFTRVFHNVYNISPNNYIIQIRIQNSYSLLKNSSLSISEVAFLCGFNDSTYYTRQFKKLTGFTPGQYRKFLISS